MLLSNDASPIDIMLSQALFLGLNYHLAFQCNKAGLSSTCALEDSILMRDKCWAAATQIMIRGLSISLYRRKAMNPQHSDITYALGLVEPRNICFYR